MDIREEKDVSHSRCEAIYVVIRVSRAPLPLPIHNWLPTASGRILPVSDNSQRFSVNTGRNILSIPIHEHTRPSSAVKVLAAFREHSAAVAYVSRINFLGLQNILVKKTTLDGTLGDPVDGEVQWLGPDELEGRPTASEFEDIAEALDPLNIV